MKLLLLVFGQSNDEDVAYNADTGVVMRVETHNKAPRSALIVAFTNHCKHSVVSTCFGTCIMGR